MLRFISEHSLVSFYGDVLSAQLSCSKFQSHPVCFSAVMFCIRIQYTEHILSCPMCQQHMPLHRRTGMILVYLLSNYHLPEFLPFTLYRKPAVLSIQMRLFSEKLFPVPDLFSKMREKFCGRGCLFFTACTLEFFIFEFFPFSCYPVIKYHCYIRS